MENRFLYNPSINKKILTFVPYLYLYEVITVFCRDLTKEELHHK